MKNFAMAACLLAVCGCEHSTKSHVEEHVGGSQVEVTGDPRVTDADGGQGSGATGTGGTGASEPDVDGSSGSGG